MIKNLFIIVALMITLAANSQSRLNYKAQYIFDEFKEDSIVYKRDPDGGLYLLFYVTMYLEYIIYLYLIIYYNTYIFLYYILYIFNSIFIIFKINIILFWSIKPFFII